MKPIIAVTLLTVLAVWSNGARGEDAPQTLSITVAVDPPMVPGQIGAAETVEAYATVSGKTDPVGDNPTVEIEFVPDSTTLNNSKESVKATAKVDGKGDYSKRVTITDWGHYIVTVTAPDGKGKATSKFYLQKDADVPDELEATFSLKGEAARIDSLLAQIAGLPASPARIEAEKKVGKVSAALKGWPEQSKKLKEAVQKFQEITKKYPATRRALQPRLQALADVASKNKAQQERTEQELAKSRSASATCEKLDAIIEGLKQASVALNFIHEELTEVIEAFGLENASERFTKFVTPKSLEGNKEAELFIATSSKLAMNLMAGPVGLVEFVGATLVESTTYVQEKNFEKYCEKIEGPMNATMHADIKQGEATWWTYDIRLDGKLVLRYAKGAAPGAAVHVNGEFIGSASKLGVTEDALAVLYPVTQKTSTLLRKLIIPPGVAYVEGSALRAAGPNAFNVEVEGEIVGDKLTLTPGTARSDLSDLLEAHVTYVLIGPMLLAPIIVKYDLPFTKAQKLLFRSMNDGPIEIPVEVTDKGMTMQKNLTRRRPGEGNVVDYTLNIHACNPSCK